MDNIYWGMKNNKRTFNQLDGYDDCDNLEPRSKRARLFTNENDMIYSRKNEIHFTDEINKVTIEKMIKTITKIITKNYDKYIDTEKILNITYIVDSPGGSVTAILKFVDFLSIVKKKYPNVQFTSIATGLVASAGTIMCVVADNRLITKNASAMIHELASGNSGKYTHFMSYSKFLTELHSKLLNIYLENSEQTKEVLEQLLQEETWYNAENYLKLGFVDEIVN